MTRATCQKCQAAEARATECLGMLNEAQARAVDLEAALRGLLEHCAMVHKNWGDGDNRAQADAAEKAARALIEVAA